MQQPALFRASDTINSEGESPGKAYNPKDKSHVAKTCFCTETYMNSNSRSELTPVRYTSEEHTNTFQGQFWVLKKLRSQDSCLIFVKFSHESLEFSQDSILGLC